MKEIVVVSGKGGTGKTSVVASLACLIDRKAMVDCDVDAANLALVLNPRVIEEKEFTAGKKARIMNEKCTACGVCRDMCRFNAISEDFIVDPVACEGCGACFFYCPASAVEFETPLAGHCYICDTPAGDPFVYAELSPGEENSGKLVNMVRTEAKARAEHAGLSRVLIDGPPGIGCPVISSITGTSLALIVTEPTASGIHDLERIAQLARHFSLPAAVIINKSDINPACTNSIDQYCSKNDIPVLGRLPYDATISEAQRQGKAIVEYAPDLPVSKALREISEHIISIYKE
ncbi:MAG: CobQ/CobB/MinD/ParA nucleotide binding domain protein [Syntrophorhabdus sp. PtaB.Bin047]|jgi:MinD superfamily P-loop ATPase|nr:MAG: CobQ/CobB/MinD/ParA nucleotide binding domain protein [Syntrophorhabdus sp. PtaB.Bin047]